MGLDPVEVVFSVSAPSAPSAASESADIFSYHAGPVKVPGPWKRGRPRGSRKKTREPNGGHHERGHTESPLPPFEFIHLSPSAKDIDGPAQARIRSHARRSRAGKGAVVGQQGGHRLRLNVDAFVGRNVRVLVECYNLRQIDGVDPFNTLPIHFEPYMHDLLVFLGTTVWKSLYTLERAVGFNPFVEYGLPLGFADPALLHTFIGCADTFVSYFARNNDGTRALWHLHRAISIVNRRIAETTAATVGNRSSLSSTSSIDSSTLVMVAGIAMFEPGNWNLHMQGLKQLVHHYGGIERLYAQPYVLQKIFRADLYGSLDKDSPPFFDGHGACSHLAEACLPNSAPHNTHAFYSAGFEALSRASSLDPMLCRCICQLEEAMLLWTRMGRFSAGKAPTTVTVPQNSMQKPTAAAATQLRYLLTGVQYRLLSDALRQALTAAPDPRDRRLGEICRIALILFSLTILNERPSHMDYGLQHARTLWRVLKEEEEEEEETSITSMPVPARVDVQLWALVLATSVTGGGTAWLGKAEDGRGTGWPLEAFAGLLASSSSPPLSSLSASGCDGGSGSCVDGAYHTLQARLHRYLWVPSIHDDLLRQMWTAAMTATLVSGSGFRQQRPASCKDGSREQKTFSV